jgi:hypothetical protein
MSSYSFKPLIFFLKILAQVITIMRQCTEHSYSVTIAKVKVVEFKPLAPHSCGFESRQGLWIISCEEAIKLAYETSVILL